ncbi:MAG: redox-sensing transcriptional repressor Rex [Clostridia bacterium]|nr:redox-sensing transcriptional repressor Rex [Clostridia bacterium]MBQ2938884.1 redox-sensing transcriptional repressor Rex [Clostridia bacterium]
MEVKPISRHTLQRLPYYLHYLQALQQEQVARISAPTMAADLHLNEVKVRKDLASVSHTGGKPKTGFAVDELIADIEEHLGYHNIRDIVLVGVGHLGRALLHYRGFEAIGYRFVAAFDNDPQRIGTEVNGIPVFSTNELADYCHRHNICLGVITVPADSAQAVADRLIDGQVLAIWNFAPVRLTVPEDILVQNENMASSLAVLSDHLKMKLDDEL